MTQIRRHTAIGVAVLLVATIAAGWWWHAGRAWSRDAAQRPKQAAGADTAGMSGMPGMPGMSDSSEAGGPSVGRSVQIGADQIRQFGVTFGTVERREMRASIRAVGTVTVDETRLTRVTPRFGGFVEELYVDQTGEVVQRGDSLMAVYSPDLMAAQQDLLTAATLQRAIGDAAVPGVPGSSTDLVAAARRRLELWNISDAQITEVLRSREPRRTLTLHAPATGVVLEKNVVRAQSVQPGQTLYTIANLDVVWIDVALREADGAAARVGAAATIDVAGLRGRTLIGRVAYVYPTLDSVARTVRARVTARNADGVLKPGMYATVTITSPLRRALTVPTSALLRTGVRTLVFVDRGITSGTHAIVPTEIHVGETAGAYTEVLSGLEPGQQVATSAQFLLDSESNLAEVMKSMIGQMNSSDMGKDMPGMPGMKMPPTPRK